jgi:hypothetical protein
MLGKIKKAFGGKKRDGEMVTGPLTRFQTRPPAPLIDRIIGGDGQRDVISLDGIGDESGVAFVHPSTAPPDSGNADLTSRTTKHNSTLVRSSFEIIPVAAAWVPDKSPSRRSSMGGVFRSLFSSGATHKHSREGDSRACVTSSESVKQGGGRTGHGGIKGRLHQSVEMDPRVAQLPDFDEIARPIGGGALRVQPRERLPHNHDRYFFILDSLS